MKVSELLEKRRQNWQELETLCNQVASRGKRNLGATAVSRFAALYRSACADLALADAYQLPPNTVHYLHRLVGRAHNQLYRSRIFNFAQWGRMLFLDAPRKIFGDGCVIFAFCFFWGIFLLSAVFAYSEGLWPGYAEKMLRPEGIQQLESSFENPMNGRNFETNFAMAAFYIQHNTGIGLQCFAYSLLIIPGMCVTMFNSAYLGAAFGYMFRPDVDSGANFRNFVTAHGPFELTAIALSYGAGLRLGMSWLITKGLTRLGSLRQTATETMPIMGAAMGMFFMAAGIEAFVSPSGLWWEVKATVAILSTAVLLFYFVGMGIFGKFRG